MSRPTDHRAGSQPAKSPIFRQIRRQATQKAIRKLKPRVDVVDGLENFPEALQMLFAGQNHGKLVLKAAAD